MVWAEVGTLLLRHEMKNIPFLTATALANIAMFTSGCSAVFNRSHQPVQIVSNPIGASFEISNRAGQHVGSGTTRGSIA